MSFRLDRTAHNAGTHEQATHYHASQQPITLDERLSVAAYLNSVAYCYDLDNPPRLDRLPAVAVLHRRVDRPARRRRRARAHRVEALLRRLHHPGHPLGEGDRPAGGAVPRRGGPLRAGHG
ncbi:MAG: hypothetical protein EOO60_12405, partial [Hymenobacter sp.]